MGRAYNMHGDVRNAYRILIGKHDEKRPHWSPRHK
jgi:hypothetical protein